MTLPPRLLRALFLAYVIATVAHIAVVVAHEPFAFDAWNVAVDTDAQPATVGRFLDYWQYQYAHSNPRLGQPLTYLAYKLELFAVIATPLAYVALTLAIVVVGIGRLPRQPRELGLWAFVVGACWFALPDIGRVLFNRAYSANYVYAAAIQMWLVAWLRLANRASGDWMSIAAYGALAGMCNEHTGPALVLLTLVYAWWERRAGRSAKLPLAGAAGAFGGVLAILLAPGQSERYSGLVERVGLVDQVFQRGIAGGLSLVRDYLTYAAPLLALIAVVLVTATFVDEAARRRAAWIVGIALATGVLVAGTILASPKLGSRFFIAPLALLLAGAVALLDATRVRLAPFVVVAVLASGYAAARTVPLYLRVSEQSDERMTALEETMPGEVYVATPWEQIDESWWFIGDDFRNQSKRELVAKYFGLTRVELRLPKKRTH